MNLEVLVSTMNQSNHSLIHRMNLQSDAIIINQCDKNDYEELKINNNHIRLFSFNERGVGLSRNSALMRATADICLFADDDVVYGDGYKEKIIKAFEENPNADIIVFNVPSENVDRPEYIISKYRRVRFHNCMRYGTFRIAARVDSIRASNICFSLLFGGGSKYGSGEDTLFLTESLKRGLKIYASPVKIGTVNHNDSTWFKGYTEKFFKDKGALFYSISKPFSSFLCLQLAIRRRKMFKDYKSWGEAFKLMRSGIRECKKLKS